MHYPVKHFLSDISILPLNNLASGIVLLLEAKQNPLLHKVPKNKGVVCQKQRQLCLANKEMEGNALIKGGSCLGSHDQQCSESIRREEKKKGLQIHHATEKEQG